jgi:hypothetical protein
VIPCVSKVQGERESGRSEGYMKEDMNIDRWIKCDGD